MWASEFCDEGIQNSFQNIFQMEVLEWTYAFGTQTKIQMDIQMQTQTNTQIEHLIKNVIFLHLPEWV
jgi:hypothetical protein